MAVGRAAGVSVVNIVLHGAALFAVCFLLSRHRVFTSTIQSHSNSKQHLAKLCMLYKQTHKKLIFKSHVLPRLPPTLFTVRGTADNTVKLVERARNAGNANDFLYTRGLLI